MFSSVAFGTAFALDLLAAGFYQDSSRLELTLLPAWIKGMPFLSSVLMATGKAVVAQSASGKLVNVQRYVCWMHTTPAVLYLIKSVSVTITTPQMYSIILLHELQLGMGAVAKLTGGMTEVVLGLLTHLALVPVLLFLHKGLKELGTHYSKNIARFVYLTTLLTYGVFGVVWDLDAFNMLTPDQEEGLYLLAELAAKILFSTVLLFSNFRASDMRRVAVMRNIESASKQRLIEELQKLVEQKDAFMSSVSHELRTPLNGIIGLSEAALYNSDAAAAQQQQQVPAQPGPLAVATRQQFALIRSSGLRLLSLVNDIIDATALEHARLQLACQRVTLRPLVEEVADITRALLKPGVVLVTRVPHDLEVRGDAGRIIQVLNNLVSNAVKFTESGTITITARLGVQDKPSISSSSSSSSRSRLGKGSNRSSSQPQEVVMISVQDTGYGIPANKLQTIFLPFEQVHVSVSRSQRGLGLGLSIVQQLVNAMGGRITATSREGKGSTFTLTLPVYTPEAVPAAADKKAAACGSTVSAALPAVRGSRQGAAAGVSRGQLDDAAAEPSTPSTSQAIAAAGAAAAGDDDEAAAAAAAAAAPGGRGSRVLSGRQAEMALGSAQQGAGVVGAGLELWLDPSGLSGPTVCQPDPDAAVTAAEVAVCNSGADAASSMDDWPSAHQQGLEPAIHSSLATHGPALHGDAGDDDDAGSSSSYGVAYAPSGLASDAAAAAAAGDGNGRHDDSGGAAGPAVAAGPVQCGTIPGRQFYSEVRSSMQLLVVDDDSVNHQVLSLLLESAGYALVHVMSGEAALSYLAAAALLPDLVLLDVSMPGMDGREVCRRVRAMMSDSELHLPIVMLTAQVSAYAVDVSIAAGADDHLGKPFARDELLQCIANNYNKQQRASGQQDQQ